MSTEPGKTLPRYRLVHKIGAGGMGEVWKAPDTDRGAAELRLVLNWTRELAALR